MSHTHWHARLRVPRQASMRAPSVSGNGNRRALSLPPAAASAALERPISLSGPRMSTIKKPRPNCTSVRGLRTLSLSEELACNLSVSFLVGSFSKKKKKLDQTLVEYCTGPMQCHDQLQHFRITRSYIFYYS